ncbi:hypothetical protein EDB81DRAFT_112125 [Dactylonectria macrodidyma]|uniref:Zn(2)-C6 fungal-type domain-containing protein n=1 Tax=Dactylonectria macrodidyma TaxID=307937 RepID=A0A9P9EAH4_9HYPO|nr:hypothetical protein EDB81DRAFT_112125 [Dactylonectria macrodidyma]
MSTKTLGERSRVTRRRNHKACKRCRDQKIKCSGSRPCEPCKRRNLACNYDDQTDKVLVTRRYIDGLHDKLASLERRVRQSESPGTANQWPSSPQHDGNASTSASRQAFSQPTESALDLSVLKRPSHGANTASEAPLTNPLAFHTTDWVPGPTGHPVFMGTSSNWAFGRRVLTMTYERLMETPLPTSDLLFDGNVYDLKWNGEREPLAQYPTLPTRDFALHLINAFKFHCCQLFHLFEERAFMKQFDSFHQDPTGRSAVSALWYIHYLLILAFGQAFVNQPSKVQRPPGGDLFLHAMRSMPDFTFLKADPIEKMQVLACVALYLQCIDCRPAAYQNIGQALSIALEHGMHTEMQSRYMDGSYVERCRAAWWTIYILERRMGSLLGVPMAIAEESISTPIPTPPGQPQISSALQLQVRFAQTLAMIDQTVYGIEGKLDSRYLGATQSVLRRIANITEQLNESFNINENDSNCGISRIAAHLHLQQHHCVILTTRPLLYIFLQSKLGHSESVMMRWLQSETIHCLLRICVESAQQALTILSHLLDQGLLETFLPFDLDATFTSTIALLIAAVVDPSLLHDHSPWSQRAYAILDEMDSRGNSMAGMTYSELKMLENLLKRLSPGWEVPTALEEHASAEIIDTCTAGEIDVQSLDIDFSTEFGLYHGLDAEQLMNLADSLDLDSLAWPLPGADDLTDKST